MLWLLHIYCTNVYNNNYFHQTPFIRFEDCTKYPKWFCSIFLNSSVLWYRYPCLIGQQNITRVRQEFRYFTLLKSTRTDKASWDDIKWNMTGKDWIEENMTVILKCLFVLVTPSPPNAPSRANINCTKSLVFFIVFFCLCLCLLSFVFCRLSFNFSCLF